MKAGYGYLRMDEGLGFKIFVSEFNQTQFYIFYNFITGSSGSRIENFDPGVYCCLLQSVIVFYKHSGLSIEIIEYISSYSHELSDHIIEIYILDHSVLVLVY